MLKYLLAWFPMMVIAIANGVLRQSWYGKKLRELRAHQLSTLIGAVLLGLYIWLLLAIWPLESGAPAITVGLVWLGMTVGFEFLFGHFVAGHSWQRLLRDYNLRAGRVWSLFLIWVALAPYIFYLLKK